MVASHSEVLLHEAVDRDTVVAFVGRPHRVDDRGSQVLKALREIGFEHYAQAHETGWALYLGNAAELAVLRTLARRIGHGAALEALRRPLVHYVAHQPNAARRRQLANYLCSQVGLAAYAAASVAADELGPLFSPAEGETRRRVMRRAIAAVRESLQARGAGSPWSADLEAGDEVLRPLFHAYFETLGLPTPPPNGILPELAEHVPEQEIDPEIRAKLDAIVQVAAEALPAAAGD